MIYSYFNHPNTVCMSYFKHWKFSMYLSGCMMMGSIKAIIHAFVPMLCIKSSSDMSHYIIKSITESGCKN